MSPCWEILSRRWWEKSHQESVQLWTLWALHSVLCHPNSDSPSGLAWKHRLTVSILITCTCCGKREGSGLLPTKQLWEVLSFALELIQGKSLSFWDAFTPQWVLHSWVRDNAGHSSRTQLAHSRRDWKGCRRKHERHYRSLTAKLHTCQACDGLRGKKFQLCPQLVTLFGEV